MATRTRGQSVANLTTGLRTPDALEQRSCRNWPVADVRMWRDDFPAIPSATTRPPPPPPSGPRSITWSATSNHIQVVLDDDDRVALVDELVEHIQQLARVFEMQTGRRLVEDVERPPGAAPRELARELHTLRFAAAQRRRRLPELDVAKTDILQRAQLVGDRRKVLEQRQRLIDSQVEHFGDRLARDSESRASRGCSAGPCTART